MEMFDVAMFFFNLNHHTKHHTNFIPKFHTHHEYDITKERTNVNHANWNRNDYQIILLYVPGDHEFDNDGLIKKCCNPILIVDSRIHDVTNLKGVQNSNAQFLVFHMLASTLLNFEMTQWIQKLDINISHNSFLTTTLYEVI
ncbi:hypothetical protein ACJX0J_027881 [Zea mays]